MVETHPAGLHPFDAALALEPLGGDRFRGHTSAAYWNMVGPFGGITAANILQGVLQHPALLGEPVSITVNYAAGVAEGPFELLVRPVRTNRSTQHWSIELTQTSTEGAVQTLTTATVLTAARRQTWSQNDMPMPASPPPADCKRLQGRSSPIAWFTRYEMRPIQGALPRTWDGVVSSLPPEEASTSRLWLRDDPPRPMDFPSLCAYADNFYPRVWLRRPQHVPAGTVSFTVYFHADGAMLRTLGDGHVLCQARGQAFFNGFFDQSAQLWAPDGTLLATSTQIVYYKE